MSHPFSVLVPLALLTAIAPSSARADHGASDERVSLPDGPGSIGGVGDNVDVDANMGSMTYQVSVELPRGFAGATPSVGLAYSSAAGSSEVGVGWSMGTQSIERMRLRGLPVYDETDELAVDGGAELVRVGMSGTSATYRARFERAFIRYQWRDIGDGSGGYWIAEHPDGSISYYGADETGTEVRTARVETPDGGCYRYMLVARQDVYGHVVRYRYVKDGEHSLLDEVAYAEDASGTARFSVRFAYEARPDPVQTGEPGFLLTLSQRLREIRVRSGSEMIRRYVLGYETEARSGGVSRLALVSQYGRGDELSPVRFDFAYSRSLDGACEGSCDGPFVVDMGRLPAGADVRSGSATLLDVNGDALPDILSTDSSGRHTWVPARLDATTGTPSWGTAYPSTATGATSAFVLGAPRVQVLDVNGDGFTDIVEGSNGDVLCNDGSGDWNGRACLMNATLPVLDTDEVGDPNPLHVRFFDYDDDKRIDLVRTVGDVTEVFVNDGTSFTARPVDSIGAVFDESPTLQLADMNGDGLQDPVEFLSASEMRFRINLGFGRWTEWQSVAFTGFGGADLGLLQLEDVNGDGLADVVLVAGTEVLYAVNRNGAQFDTVVTLTSDGVTGDIPERVTGTTVVLFADMNGSGSRDVVWIDGSQVRFLELFPIRPNLLAHVENGIGGVQEIEYGTSVRQLWRDAETDPWEHRLPYPMNVVVATDTWNRLTGSADGAGLHERSEMLYRDGFYDGVERAFRGYAYVERVEDADMASDDQLGNRTVLEYDVGAGDAYRHGLGLRAARFGGATGAWSPIVEERFAFEDCPLSEIPSSGLRVPVRWICQTEQLRILQEGAAEEAWATLRSETDHDGYGQVTRHVEHGVVHLGPPEDPTACGACGDTTAPCGAECLGDETYAESTYVAPGTATGERWILGRAVREIRYGEAGGPTQETVTRYDGPDFVGLEEGRLERGAPTSVRTRLSDTEWIDTMRVSRDAHGNVAETIDPDGAIDVVDDSRGRLTYDDLGLRIVRVEQLFHDTEGRAASLQREYAYESAFLNVSEATDWVLVRGGDAITPRNTRRWRYDAFGRTSAFLQPGDTDAAPTEEYVYELASPVSRVISRSRSVAGGTQDVEEITCVDGMGREVQSRTRLGPSSYQVSGFRVLNRRGNPIRVYQEYVGATSACDASEPTGVPYETFRYDGQERLFESTQPDEGSHGSRSTVRVVRGPLSVTRYDQNDTDTESAHGETPLVERYDGQNRLVSIARDLGDGTVATTTLEYDSLGRLVTVRAPGGIEHTQTYDLLDRVLSSTDPDRGTIRYAYDAEGHVVEREDARGERSVAEYDGLGRLIAQEDPSAPDATRVELVYDEDEDCADCTNAARRLVSMRYPLGEHGEGLDRAGYDARGNVVYQSRTLEGHDFTLRHEYDALGRLVRSTLPGGIELERSFDAGSRPRGIAGVVDDVGYDDRGRLSTLFYTNGVTAERGYDDVGRLEALETISGGRVLQGVSMEHDRMGNILAVADTSEPEIARPSLGARFGYDAWDRLVTAELGDASAIEETVSYAFDDSDRMTSIVSSRGAASRAHVGTLEYDDAHPNAVRRAGDRAYTYDASGNVLTRGTNSFEYDHLGRMVAGGDAGSRGEFFYAGASRAMRVEEGGVTYYVGEEVEVRDGIVYVYPRIESWRLARMRSDAIQTTVLDDVVADGEIDAADGYAARIADDSASAAMRLLRGAARRLLTLDGGDLAYLHQDALGSITLATDADGAQLGEQLYYPTGELRHRSGFTDEHGYSGQEEDASTGLLAYQFRFLDTDVGRWTSPDPAFATLTSQSVRSLGEATSGYAYVANHLGNAIDRHGLAAARSPSFAPATKWQRARAYVASLGRTFASDVTSGYGPQAAALHVAGRVAWDGLKAVGRGIARAAGAAGAAYSRFAAKHPYVAFGLKVAGYAAIGFALGGPLGAAAWAIGAVAGELITRGVQAFVRHTATGRRWAAAVHRGWTSLGRTWPGKIAQGLIIGVVAGAYVASVLYPGPSVPITPWLSFSAGWGGSLALGGAQSFHAEAGAQADASRPRQASYVDVTSMVGDPTYVDEN